MNHKVVYTSICGKLDSLPVIKDVQKDWDYVCFTSEDLKPVAPWEIVKVKPLYKNPKDARLYKHNPHIYLKKYDISMWIDANIRLNKGWIDVVNECLSKSDLTFLNHPQHVGSAYEEGSRCVSLKKDTENNIRPQLECYIQEGLKRMPTSATGIMIRRHNRMINFNNMWWEQIHKYSWRDQISLPYVKWKTGVKYYETEFRAPWYTITGHRRRA